MPIKNYLAKALGGSARPPIPLGILVYNQNFLWGGGGRSGGWGEGNSERCLKRGASALNILIHTSHAHAIVFQNEAIRPRRTRLIRNPPF